MPLIVFMDEAELVRRADEIHPIMEAIEKQLEDHLGRVIECKGKSAQHTGYGCAEGGSETPEATTSAPWYEPLIQFSTSINPERVREIATELMMLGELGLPREKALESVYRSLGNGFFTTEQAAS